MRESNKLFLRFFAPPAILLVLLGTVAVWIGRESLTDRATAGARRHLEGVASLLSAEATEALRQEAPATWARRISDQLGLRIGLLGPVGQFVADSGDQVGHSPNETAQPEILAARAGGSGFAWREVGAGGSRVGHFAVRLGSADGLLGFLRVSDLDSELDVSLARLDLFVLLSAAACLCLAAMWSLRSARELGIPLERILVAVRSMSAGDFEPRLHKDELGPFEDLGGRLLGVANLARDRTEAGASDRHKVAAVLGAMVEGVVAVDAEHVVLHMNAAASRILAVQTSRTEGRPVREVTRLPEVVEILAAVVESGREQNRDLRVVMPPRDRWVEMHAAPLRAQDGAVVGAVLVLHDVTELRRLESMRRDFVANVSHELKTPIAAIRGIVETVLDDTEMEADTRSRFLGRAREQSLRLSTLVSDLLTLSRVESGDPSKDRVRLDLRSVIRDCAGQLGGVIEPRGLSVLVAVPDSPVLVLGDADSLKLMVSNLLDNAVKYSPEGGTIDVRVATDNGRARLEVEDRGVGIERKHLDRIFQRFYRVDRARSRELGGTGLGLSIVKHVALAHGGEVGVESEVGRGSVFRVVLPLA